MITRNIQQSLIHLSSKFPIVTITGPRQSGKTTLCRMAFSDKDYVSLEYPDIREFAYSDPRGFLAQYPNGAVLDEIQRVPELLSYIQGDADKDRTPGKYILTGSSNFSLIQSISQSLAGRTALLTLLPLAYDEAQTTKSGDRTLFEVLHTGGYPAIFDRNLHPHEWFQGYIGTYIERDVRQLLNISDMIAFQSFLGMCAGLSSRLLNLSQLGSDCGVTHNTAKSWISVLEASYILHRLPPFMANIKKQLTKTPKLFLLDTGLMCYLLGIRSPDDLVYHPLRGAIFETWVVSEILKHRFNAGETRRIHFFRDRGGLEVDALIDTAHGLLCAEMKSGQTIASDQFRSLSKVKQLLETQSLFQKIHTMLIYGGTSRQLRKDGTVLPWNALHKIAWI
jgi:uncharacterized protein